MSFAFLRGHPSTLRANVKKVRPPPLLKVGRVETMK